MEIKSKCTPNPRFALLDGELVRISSVKGSGLRAAVWRDGAWIPGASVVDADFNGTAISNAEAYRMIEA